MTIILSFLLASVSMEPTELCALTVFPEDLDPKELDIAAVEDIADARPECMPAHFLRGFAALDDDNGDRETAVLHFERALALDSKNSYILLWLGRTHGALAAEQSSLSHARKSKKYLQEAISADPENLAARSTLAGYHRNAPWIAGGRMKAAYQQAEEIAARDPQRGKLELARTLMADEKHEQARALFLDLIARDDADPAHVLEYAILNQHAKDFAEAHRVLFAITRDEDADANALYQLGRTAALSGQFLGDGRAAMTRYLARFEREPSLPIKPAAALWRLGMIEQHAEQIPAAIAAYEKALEFDPDFREAADALKMISGRD